MSVNKELYTLVEVEDKYTKLSDGEGHLSAPYVEIMRLAELNDVSYFLLGGMTVIPSDKRLNELNNSPYVMRADAPKGKHTFSGGIRYNPTLVFVHEGTEFGNDIEEEYMDQMTIHSNMDTVHLGISVTILDEDRVKVDVQHAIEQALSAEFFNHPRYLFPIPVSGVETELNDEGRALINFTVPGSEIPALVGRVENLTHEIEEAVQMQCQGIGSDKVYTVFEIVPGEEQIYQAPAYSKTLIAA